MSTVFENYCATYKALGKKSGSAGVKMKASILMFSLWMIKVRAECPSSCNCTTTSVLCVKQDLESVPNLYCLQYSPVILDFSGNNLLFIEEDDFNFPKNDEVKEIYLNNSGITDIGQGAFDNVENLQELYLGQNFLSSNSVPTNLIEELDNMVLLDMSNNYFSENMPIIRSDSLEVLALVNSKISAIPENALRHLPNLKLLLLQQNNIQSLSLEPFKNYAPKSFSMKLSFNSWTCSCTNLRTFQLLGNRKFVDTSEPYQCVNIENKIINIFNNNGAIELLSEECNNDIANFNGHQEVRDMVEEDRKDLKNLNVQNDTAPLTVSDASYEYTDDDDDSEIDIKEMNDEDLEAALPGNCWDFFTNACGNKGLLTVALISSLITFFIGLIGGAIFGKMLYTYRYKKLEPSSDSQVQLLKA